MTDTDALRSDEELLGDLIRGDRRAFDLLLHRHGRRLFLLAQQVLGRPEDAEEVVQESFVKLLTHGKSYRGEGPVIAWLQRIASHLSLSRLRSRRRRLAHETPVGDEERLPPADAMQLCRAHLDDPAARVQRRALVDGVRAGLDTLPPDQRLAFVLRVFHGKSYREIAEVLECSLGTVQSRIARARERLRRHCNHESEACP